MSWRCENPEKYQGRVVDNGECVRFVQVAAGVPHTSTWSQGERVKDALHISPGTAIATFVNGAYPSDGNGKHAAIYIRHDSYGIEVWDQWRGHSVSRRTIAYQEGDPYRSNDGDTFYVIE